MKNSEIVINHREKYRHIVRDILGLLLVLGEGLLFYYFWTEFLNPFARNPYVSTGNFFLLGVYICLTLVFSSIYGGLKLGYYRLLDIILSQTVCAVVLNTVVYFAVVIPIATWYLSPLPLIVMTLADIIWIILWSVAGNWIFSRLFPPQRLVVIYTRESDLLAAKFADRTDRYKIIKKIRMTDAKAAADSCVGYDGAVIGDIPAGLRNDLLKRCYSLGIRTYTLPKLSDVILKGSEILNIFDSPVFLNRNYGLTIEQEFVKRVFDLVVSGIGILLCSPLLLLTAAAIKLDDGGPVFFRQKRCTRGGREFEIIKFRSMIVDAEAAGIAVPATEHDPRITRVGRMIRATRIDELPQLFNIFKGDMSVVGPRPERIEHVRKYTEEIPEFRYRMLVKGGLTGYAQIYGKYNTLPYDKLKLDLLYIQNYSLLLDISLILQTLKVIFMKESTEGFDENRSKEMGEK